MSKRSAEDADINIDIDQHFENILTEPLSEELQWVSASKTANWMRRDPILDYFEMYCTDKPFNIPKIIMDVSEKNMNTKQPRIEVLAVEKAHEFMMQQGKNFEQSVVTYIKKHFKNDVLQIVYDRNDVMLQSKANETFDAMKQGVPFIYQGVLHDWDNKTFGSPDFLVRSDYLHKLVKTSPLKKEEWEIKAPNLFDVLPCETFPFQRSKFTKKKFWKKKYAEQPKYHYVIVDVKYSTLKMRTDNIHLTNSGNMAVYKAQMYIYQRALAKLQGYDPKCTYLLGRNWSMVKMGTKHYGKGPFEKLGSINFHDDKLDKPIIAKTEEAVKWIRKLRTEGMFWTLYPKPSVYELYPNMANKQDAAWHEKKKELAEKIHEITNVWYCGVKQRKRAHDIGITEWSDPELNAEKMGFKKRKTDSDKLRLGDVVDKILDINRQNDDLVRPDIIYNNIRNWQTSDESIETPIEFFVDFETIHDAAASTADNNVNGLTASTFGLSECSKSIAKDMIFMIGVGWVEHVDDSNSNNNNKIWQYRNFTAEKMTFEAERKILNDFYNLIKTVFDREISRRQKTTPNFWQILKGKINQIAAKFRRGDATLEDVKSSQLHVNLYHWGHIEKKAYERAMQRHPREKFHDGLVSNNWVNFYEVMRNEPIVIKGALSFGLKSVVNALNNNNLIQLKYDEQGCSNGMQAMIDAVAVYKSGENIENSKKMNSIIAYNEIDCKAVHAVINYLRSTQYEKNELRKSRESNRTEQSNTISRKRERSEDDEDDSSSFSESGHYK